MTRLFEAQNKDWNVIAQKLMDHCDADYSGRIDAREFANALLYEFDLTATEEEYNWILMSLSEACGEYETNRDGLGLNVTEMASCGVARGMGIWNGAKEWAADKRNGYDRTVWHTILANADTNSDGEWSAAEARAALASYFNCTVLTQVMNDTIDGKLNETC